MTIDLRRHPWSRRGMTNHLLTALACLATITALFPLFSVLWTIIRRGTEAWSWSMIWSLPPQGREAIGGFGNAVTGTLVMVGIATLLTLPLGVLSGIWLAEFGKHSRPASRLAIRHADVVWPSLDPRGSAGVCPDRGHHEKLSASRRCRGAGIAHVADDRAGDRAGSFASRLGCA
ncbi:MAG: hypothetical protein U0798_08480 [Gemmataceae bacterium]